MKTIQNNIYKFIAGLYLLFTLMYSLDSSGQVGINNANPNVSSALDITSTSKGLLVPRMTSLQRLAIVTPATGLMVYETTTNQFFYFDGAAWRPMAANNTAWNTTGNSGTNAVTNFIGTTDLIDFTFRTNNAERMRIKATGNVGIGTISPSAKLSISKPGIDDILTLSDDSSSIVVGTDFNIPGIMRFRPTSGKGIAITNNGDAIGLFVKSDATANVGIHTVNPTEALHVEGNIRMIDGNQANGKVLTSDANGKGTWQDAKRSKYTSVSGTTIALAPPTSLVLMPQMSVTFTPAEPVVYAHFNAAGANAGACGQHALSFQVLLNGAVVQTTQTSIEDVTNAPSAKIWDINIEIPLNVVTGSANTVSIFWGHFGTACSTVANGPGSAVAPNGSYRVLTVVEP